MVSMMKFPGSSCSVSVWLALLLTVIVLHVVTAFPYGDNQPLEDGNSDTDAIQEKSVDISKRPSVRLVTYKCTPFTAKCRNGGRGPRITKIYSGMLCSCLCPSQWVGPQCNYPAKGPHKRFMASNSNDWWLGNGLY